MIFGLFALIVYLCWPLAIGAKTVNGKEHYGTAGVIIFAIWLPVAIGVPLLIWWASKKSKRAQSQVAVPQQRREPPLATALGNPTSGRAQATVMQRAISSATSSTATAAVVRAGPADPRWRWMRLAQQLPVSLGRFEAEYQNQHSGGPHPSGKPISDPDGEWQRLMSEGREIALEAAGLFGSQTALFDVNKHIDEAYISEFVNSLTGKYLAMLRWSARVRSTPVSPEWSRVFELLSRFLDETIENIRRFSQWSIAFSKQALHGIPAAPLNISKDATPTLGAEIGAAAAQARAAKGTYPSDAPQVTALVPPIALSVADELRKLADLHREGVLTGEEFEAQKAKLLQS